MSAGSDLYSCRLFRLSAVRVKGIGIRHIGRLAYRPASEVPKAPGNGHAQVISTRPQILELKLAEIVGQRESCRIQTLAAKAVTIEKRLHMSALDGIVIFIHNATIDHRERCKLYNHTLEFLLFGDLELLCPRIPIRQSREAIPARHGLVSPRWQILEMKVTCRVSSCFVIGLQAMNGDDSLFHGFTRHRVRHQALELSRLWRRGLRAQQRG